MEHSVGAGMRRRAPCELRIVQTPGVQPFRQGGALCIVRQPGGDLSQRSGRLLAAGKSPDARCSRATEGHWLLKVPRGPRGGWVVVGVGGVAGRLPAAHHIVQVAYTLDGIRSWHSDWYSQLLFRAELTFCIWVCAHYCYLTWYPLLLVKAMP